MGDKLVYHNAGQEAISLEELATRGEREDGTPCWFSNENGQEIERKTYDDLSFLTMMPNLKTLQIAMADLRDVPNLKPLEKLGYVWVSDCEMQDMQWLKGSAIRRFRFESCGKQDFSPLSNCESLSNVQIDLNHCNGADLSGFAPPNLGELVIWDKDKYESLTEEDKRAYFESFRKDDAQSLDLSALTACEMLSDVEIQNASIRNLEFLRGKERMKRLYLFNVYYLADLTPVGELKNLRDCYINSCYSLWDFSSLGECTNLESLHVQDDWTMKIKNVDWTKNLTKLNYFGIFGCELPNLDFLDVIPVEREITFGYAGSIQDYSALGRHKIYGGVHTNPFSHNYAEVADALQNVSVRHMELYQINRADLSKLPNISESLFITYGNLENFSGLRELNIEHLRLYGMKRITTLDGIQNLKKFSEGQGSFELEIYNCPRLTDFSALEGKYLQKLELHGGYAMPDLSKIRTNILMLDYVDGIENLSCLASIDPQCWIQELNVYMPDEFTDLLPASYLKGDLLSVSPQFAEQAQALVDEGHFQRMEINYPDHSWQQDDSEFTLLNLEELDTLPKKLLAKVSNLILAGDRVINWEEDELREEWQNDKRQFTVFNRNTEEESKVKTGTLTDLNRLAKLTGLKSLEIDDQPLTSLEGIQGMLELEEISLKSCYQLNDISQLFTLENIRKIGLFSVPVSSIQGIQNLTKLQELKLHNTEVSDISPLAECDLTEANENGGLWLEILGSRVDTAPLESIKQFAYKQVEGQELDYSPIVNTEPEETEAPEKQGILPKLEDLVGMN